MPRKSLNNKPIKDYSKSVIYKIVPKDISSDYVFVGITTNFIEKKEFHKNNCNKPNNKNDNYKKYYSILYDIICQNGGFDNYTMSIIEEYPCNIKLELIFRGLYHHEILSSKLKSDQSNIN